MKREMNMPHTTEIDEVQRRVDVWNRTVKVGASVTYLKSDLEGKVIFKTVGLAYVLGGQAVVNLDQIGLALLTKSEPISTTEPAAAMRSDSDIASSNLVLANSDIAFASLLLVILLSLTALFYSYRELSTGMAAFVFMGALSLLFIVRLFNAYAFNRHAKKTDKEIS